MPADPPQSSTSVPNLLLAPVEYQITETSVGRWRRFMYPDGHLFEEYVTHSRLMGLPLVHFTRGKCPETGKRVVARGVIAVGRIAVGILAVGQLSSGFIAIGQLAVGILFGLGQACTGMFALGQLAVAATFGVGQLATGYAAIGQIALGKYVLAQYGVGKFVWDMQGADPIAVKFFQSLLP